MFRNQTTHENVYSYLTGLLVRYKLDSIYGQKVGKLLQQLCPKEDIQYTPIT